MSNLRNVSKKKWKLCMMRVIKGLNFDKYQKQLNKDIAEQQNEQAEINPDVDSAEVMEAQKG